MPSTNLPHPEERAQAASRRTLGGHAAANGVEDCHKDANRLNRRIYS